MRWEKQPKRINSNCKGIEHCDFYTYMGVICNTVNYKWRKVWSLKLGSSQIPTSYFNVISSRYILLISCCIIGNAILTFLSENNMDLFVFAQFKGKMRHINNERNKNSNALTYILRQFISIWDEISKLYPSKYDKTNWKLTF